MSACASCSAALPEGARFCPACGARVEERPEAVERKTVTTLFADLVGFTALGERNDPEDLDAALRHFYALARAIVERFGGTVEKFIGDAVVGLFGVPAAHEDDAEWGVRAALELVGRMHELPPVGEEALQVRCAVNTGPAFVRLGARLETGEGVLVGDAVNTCARLLTEAPPMGVVAGELTQRLSSHAIAYEELPAIVAKGKARPVQRWLAQRTIARRGVDLTHPYGAPMVGRHVELGILKGIFDRVRALSRPQLALIVGEAGVGKTRLAWELARWIDEEPEVFISWRQGRCLPYGEGSGFQPLADVVRAHAGIMDGDDDDAMIAKLERAVGDAPEREWIVDRLRALLGLPSRPAGSADNFAAWTRFLDIVARERPAVVFFDDLHWADQGLLDFLVHLLNDGCAAPLLLLGAARPELPESHPEFSRYLGAATDRAASMTRVDLLSLTPPEALRLVTGLSPQVPDDLAEVVVERSGGNPFYAEELVRLLEHESSGKAVDRLQFDSLPASLQALLTARLDTLEAEPKGALSDAAVVGQTFPLELVAALGDHDPGDLRGMFEALSVREFVRPAPDDAPTEEPRLAFRHAMMRDAAYSQLSRRARIDKHARAAQWLERHAGERADFAGAVAYHYSTALDLARLIHEDRLADDLLEPTVHSLRLAGDRAFQFDPAAAERDYDHALRLLPPDSPHKPDLIAAHARTLQLLGRYREASDALAVAATEFAADGRRHEVLLTTAYITLAGAHLSAAPTDIEETAHALLASEEFSFELLDALDAAATTAGNSSDHTLALALAERALVVLAHLGWPHRAGVVGRRGYERCAVGDAGGLDDLDAALEMAPAQSSGRELCAIYANSGEAMRLYRNIDVALDLHRRALTRALQMPDDPYAVCFSRFGLFLSLVAAGEWDEALTHADDLDRGLEELGDIWSLQFTRATTGLVWAARGEPETGAEGALWAERSSRDRGPSISRAHALASLAVVERAMGDEVGATSLLEEYIVIPSAKRRDFERQVIPETARCAISLGRPDIAMRCGDGLLEQRPYDTAALHLLAAIRSEYAGDIDRAAAQFERATDGWRELGFAYERAQALMGRGRCLALLGDERAAAALAEARVILARLGARPALADLDELMSGGRLSSVSPRGQGQAQIPRSRADHKPPLDERR